MPPSQNSSSPHVRLFLPVVSSSSRSAVVTNASVSPSKVAKRLPILFQNYGHTSVSTVRCDFCSCSFSSSTSYPRLLRQSDNFAQIILRSDSPLNVLISGRKKEKKTTASHFASQSVMRSYPFFLPDAIEFSLQNTTTKRPCTRSSSSSPPARELAARSPRRARTGAEARHFAAQVARAVYHRTAVDLDEEIQALSGRKKYVCIFPTSV